MFFAIIAGAGILSGCAMIPVYFWLGCGLGLFLIALACYFARVIWMQHQTELHAVAQGILTEAEVVELKEEKDSDGKLTTMAVYEFALPGGAKHRFKESVSSSMAGILGLIRVGVKLPLFVDRNNPDIYTGSPGRFRYIWNRSPDWSPVLLPYLHRCYISLLM